MFDKKEAEATSGSEVEEVTPKPHRGCTPKKTTPASSRKKANATSRQPIVASHRVISREERRELKRGRSEANIARQNKQQEAMHTGGERNMPPRRVGPVRCLNRDATDSRFSPDSYFMPFALLLPAGLLVRRSTPHLPVVFAVSVHTTFIVIVVQTGGDVRRVRVLTEHEFGTDHIPQGFSMQLFSHAFYPRR